MILATFIWGSTPLMGIYSKMPSGVFVFFRVLFAFPFIFYFALKNVGLKEFFKLKPFAPIFISAVALGVNWIFFFWAVNLTDISTVVTIYYTGPIISLLLATIFLKEKLTVNIILALVLALVGVIVSNNGLKLSFGAFIALLAAICYGLLGFFSKIATIYHKPTVVTAWQILISIFITAPFLFFSNYSLTLNGLLIALITAVVHTALALVLWYDALHYIKVSIASILQYLDIVFAMILGYIFLNQVPSLNQIIGAALILLAGVISLRK